MVGMRRLTCPSFKAGHFLDDETSLGSFPMCLAPLKAKIGALEVKKKKQLRLPVDDFYIRRPPRSRCEYSVHIMAILRTPEFATHMRRLTKEANVEPILQRATYTDNIGYVRNGSRFSPQRLRRGGRDTLSGKLRTRLFLLRTSEALV